MPKTWIVALALVGALCSAAAYKAGEASKAHQVLVKVAYITGYEDCAKEVRNYMKKNSELLDLPDKTSTLGIPWGATVHKDNEFSSKE